VDWMTLSTSGQLTPMICGKNTSDKRYFIFIIFHSQKNLSVLDYHMFVDVGLEANSNSQITFYLTVKKMLNIRNLKF